MGTSPRRIPPQLWLDRASRFGGFVRPRDRNVLAGLFGLGFGTRQLPQFAEGHSLMDQQRDSHQRATGKSDDPEYGGNGNGRLLRDSKDRCQSNNAGYLRAPANPRKL